MKNERRIIYTRTWIPSLHPRSLSSTRPPNLRRHPEQILVFDMETSYTPDQSARFGAFLFAWIDEDFNLVPIEEGLICLEENCTREDFDTLLNYMNKSIDYVIPPALRPEGLRYIAEDMGMTLDGETMLSKFDRAIAAGEYDKLYPPQDLVPQEPYKARVYQGDLYARTGGRFALVRDNLMLLSVDQFINSVLHGSCYPSPATCGERNGKPATVVTFNGPFDLSRLARKVKPITGAGTFHNGFEFTLTPEEPYNPGPEGEGLLKCGNLRMTKRSAKGCMMTFAQISDSPDRGYFCDTSNLLWTLTNETWTLDAASRAFNKEHVKGPQPDFRGPITDEFITYCRDDVFATAELFCQLWKQADKYTPHFDPTMAYSPAALPKASYKAMGMKPPLIKQADFPPWILDHCMEAFLGARAETRIRRVPIPCLYWDVTSMYQTVDILLNLWPLLTCARVEVQDETEAVQTFLEHTTLDDLFSSKTWPQLRGIALVEADGDIFPIRTTFGVTGDRTIAVSYIEGKRHLWVTLPDVMAAKVLHPEHQTPKILKAFRFYPSKDKQQLHAVNLRGFEIDPNEEDFFKVAVEQRQRIKQAMKKHDHDCEEVRCEESWLTESLKVTTTSGAYGIMAEFNQVQHATPERIRLYHQIDEKDTPGMFGQADRAEPSSTTIEIDKVDDPGTWCFPPAACLITGAARLILAMIERRVADAGGCYAACDTDSMIVGASESGEPIPTESGDIPIMRIETAEEIRKSFNSLNPYDVPGIDVLKREFDDDERQLYVYAISAKRYALFRFANGHPDVMHVVDDAESETLAEIEIEKGKRGEGRKEHGLGLYKSPLSPQKDDEKGRREHVTQIWELLIRRELGQDVEEPAWFKNPAMIKVSVQTANAYKIFEKWNKGKDYRLEQFKPYNFAMAPVAVPLVGGNDGIRLIAPNIDDPDQWFDAEYLNVNNPGGPTYRIYTRHMPKPSTPNAAMVKTWGDIVRDFAYHPESKFCDADGNTCTEETTGLLYRHHITPIVKQRIGKESSHLSETELQIEPGGMNGITIEYGTGTDIVRELVMPIIEASGMTQKEVAEAAGIPTSTYRAFMQLENMTYIPRGKPRGIPKKTVQKGPKKTAAKRHESLESEQLGPIQTAMIGAKEQLIDLAVSLAVESLRDDLPNPTWVSHRFAREDWIMVLDAWKVRNQK
jgi:hypothetical protein